MGFSQDREGKRQQLKAFWEQITSPIEKYPLHERLQKYYRLAYTPLGVSSIESQVKHPQQAHEVDRGIISFVALRNEIRGIFDTNENKTFWQEFMNWMEAYHNGSVSQRDQAQHGEEGKELDTRAVALEDSLDPLWSQINLLYQHMMS